MIREISTRGKVREQDGRRRGHGWRRKEGDEEGATHTLSVGYLPNKLVLMPQILSSQTLKVNKDISVDSKIFSSILTA